MTPASCAPGPSLDGIICDVIASISAAAAGSSVWNAGGADDCAASCACCCAAATSARAAIPTHCDSQSRRVDCMIHLARSGHCFANGCADILPRGDFEAMFLRLVLL